MGCEEERQEVYVTNRALISALSIAVMVLVGWGFNSLTDSIDVLEKKQQKHLIGMNDVGKDLARLKERVDQGEALHNKGTEWMEKIVRNGEGIKNMKDRLNRRDKNALFNRAKGGGLKAHK